MMSLQLVTSRLAAVASRHVVKTTTVRAFSAKASPAFRRLQKKQQSTETSITPPLLEDVQDMPLTYQQMDNKALLQLSAWGKHDARVEMLKRHIMGVDNVSYEEACTTFKKIAKRNERGVWLMALPYQLAIGLSVSAAAASFPLVFYEPVVHWFNAAWVTFEVPHPSELETPLEVGSWSWNWMEPPLGQISFVLLCLQHARGQMHNLGVKPYTRYLKHKRAERLASEFPQYNRQVIMNYAKSDDFLVGTH